MAFRLIHFENALRDELDWHYYKDQNTGESVCAQSSTDNTHPAGSLTNCVSCLTYRRIKRVWKDAP